MSELILAAVIMGSLIAWIAAGLRWQSGVEPVVAWSQRRRVVPGIAFAAAAALVALIQALPWLSEPVVRELTVQQVQEAFVFDLGIVVMLGGMLLLGPALNPAAKPSPDESVVDAAATAPEVSQTPHTADGSAWRTVARHTARGFLLACGPVFGVLWLTTLPGWRTDETEHEFLRLLTGAGSAEAWWWVSLTAVIAAPLAEELMYRVVIQGWLADRLGAAPAIVGASLLFAFAHDFPDSIALIPLALLLGYIYHRSQSYITVVAIHALFNGLNLAMTAAGGPL